MYCISGVGVGVGEGVGVLGGCVEAGVACPGAGADGCLEVDDGVVGGFDEGLDGGEAAAVVEGAVAASGGVELGCVLHGVADKDNLGLGDAEDEIE